MQIFLLTTATMIAFAANSVLARLALADGAIDPASYTGIRLLTGALVLAALVLRGNDGTVGKLTASGNWFSALALFVYAAAFSASYIILDAGIGALILFAMVQATMISWAIYRGDRPIALEWVGLLIAFGAFAWLVSPGLGAPDPIASAMMAVSGIAWGIYSIRGKASANPLAATAGNFVFAVPFAIPIVLITWSSLNITTHGVVLAAISGAVTSGLGYALWYRVLGRITQTQGAIVQLTVPVIAAFGGVALLGEAITLRLSIASALILGGVALAIVAKAKRIS